MFATIIQIQWIRQINVIQIVTIMLLFGIDELNTVSIQFLMLTGLNVSRRNDYLCS